MVAFIKVYPVTCDIDETSAKHKFHSNNRFHVTRGKQWFVDGQLKFPEIKDPIPDLLYRTLFGPCVAHNGRVLANDNLTVRHAFWRLTRARRPTPERLAIGFPGSLDDFCDGYDQLLADEQENFVNTHTSFLDMLTTLYAPHIQYFKGTEEECSDHVGDPHDKRILRLKCWGELNDDGDRFGYVWVKHVLYKFKKDEIAKFDKEGRMIGDLGIAASLQGFVLTSLLKKAMAESPIFVFGGRLQFCSSPRQSDLDNVFRTLLRPVYKFEMFYYSDDSCFSFTHHNITYSYNLDISKCDSSHRHKMFDALKALCSSNSEALACMSVLVAQLELPIKIRSVGHEKGVKGPTVCGTFDGPTLYSGSTVTTVINNLANIFIGYLLGEAISKLEDRPYTVEELASIFTLCVEKSGYIITGLSADEICQRPVDLQFLKHSPAMSTAGIYRALKNFGVLLRASGSCKTDLPVDRQLTITQRARAFQRGLIHGTYPRTSCSILTTMLQATSGPEANASFLRLASLQLSYFSQERENERQKGEPRTNPNIPLDDEVIEFAPEAILERYCLDEEEVAAFNVFITTSTGQHTAHSFVTKILGKDYSLSTQFTIV